jgi:hypothetical protein
LPVSPMRTPLSRGCCTGGAGGGVGVAVSVGTRAQAERANSAKATRIRMPVWMARAAVLGKHKPVKVVRRMMRG